MKPKFKECLELTTFLIVFSDPKMVKFKKGLELKTLLNCIFRSENCASQRPQRWRVSAHPWSTGNLGPVWQDVGIKRRQFFTKFAQKVATAVFT